MAGANPTTPLASRCSLAPSIACGLLFVCSAGARAQDAGVQSESVDLALPQALPEEAQPAPEQAEPAPEQAQRPPEQADRAPEEASPAPAPSRTTTDDPDYSIEQLQDLSLEELLNVEVVTAAKQVESASSASAIIS